jgi:uncharacterized protein (TIRG00374 family)
MNLRQYRQRIVLSLAFAALVYLALAMYADAPRLFQAFVAWDWRWLPVALLAVLVNYGIRFARWQYYLHVIGITNVPPRSSLMVFISGFSLTMTPGKLGELIKSVLLKSHYDIPISYSASIVGAERLTDVMGMAFLAALGVSVFPNGVPALLAVLLVLAAAVGLMQSRPLAERLIDLFGRLPVVGRFASLARNMYESAFLMLRLRPLAISFVLAVMAWFGECLALYFILIGFGLSPTPDFLLRTVFTYASASLFGAATLTPGGLGTTEGSMTSLIQLLMGANVTIAAGATLLVRVCTLWFAVVLGGISLFVFGRIEARAASPAATEESSPEAASLKADAP